MPVYVFTCICICWEQKLELLRIHPYSTIFMSKCKHEVLSSPCRRALQQIFSYYGVCVYVVQRTHIHTPTNRLLTSKLCTL